ncbi:MAG: hypothetical protein DRI97_17690 [Bacteroidetes bacterium]|nr:MAG: hypothetical protein DRI97_17690 [Bacteroidota bacterium]
MDNDDDDIYGDDIGMDFSFDESIDDSVDDPDADYTEFDADNEDHRKRLQAGTPVILDGSLFPEGEENFTGIFHTRSPSGHYGTVVRNSDDAEVNVHLSDIKYADITNNSIYENFEQQFNELMEDVTVTRTANSENPELDTITITGTEGDTQQLADLMKLTGLQNTEQSVYTDVPDEVLPATQQEPSMCDMLGTVDGASEEIEEYANDPMELIADVDNVTHAEHVTGNDLHKSKRSYSDKPYRGDNPMAVAEDEEAKRKMDRLRKPWSMPPFKSKGSKGISKDKSGTGEFQGEKQNAAYVPKNSNDEDTDIEEGISDDIQKGAKKAGKWLKRGLQGWDMDYADPKDMQQKHNEYDTDSLHNLDDMHDNMKGGETKELGHSPHDLQQKLINRELRRRGERDFKKYGDSRKMTDDVEEDYSNEPDEVEATVDAQVNGMSGGINGRKKHWRKEYPGDNIMSANLEEAAEKITDANSKEGFLNLYKVINDISNAS